MLEWYRANEPYEDADGRLRGALLALAARATGIGSFSFRGKTCDPFAEPERLTVAEAFDALRRHRSAGDRRRRRRAIARRSPARRQGRCASADDDTWADIFSRMLVEQSSRNLGHGRATILFEYPAPEAALARASRADPRVAERFELYACGVELANAFGELTDAAEQRRRFEAEMAEKQRVYGERYPIDEDFLAALAQHAAGQRHRARLRSAGDAGDRRAAHRAGAMDAGRHVDTTSSMNAARHSETPARSARRMASRRPRISPTLEAVAARYAVAMTPALAALIDPTIRPTRSPASSCPTRRSSRSLQARAPTRSATTAHAGRGHRAPLSRPRAAEADPRLRGLLPLLLPARDGRPGKASACRRGARRGAGLYRRTAGDLGGDPHRRRPADAVAAPAGAR